MVTVTGVRLNTYRSINKSSRGEKGKKKKKKSTTTNQEKKKKKKQKKKKHGNFFNIHSGMHEDAGNETPREWRS